MVAGYTSATASLEDLIARCALGDRAAFVALYKATSPKLFAVILRILKRKYWAEEALQESYMKVWRSVGSYNASRGAPMTWLINIARNQALDLVRRSEFRAQKVEHVPEDESVLVSPTPDPSGEAETSAELARLRRCMEQLPEDHRHCIVLSYHEGLSPAEVAQQKRLALGTVKTWIRRGLVRIRECLGQ